MSIFQLLNSQCLQVANVWDEDLQSVVQMEFGQNQKSPFTSQGFHGKCKDVKTLSFGFILSSYV